MRLIYLASPYKHEDEDILRRRKDAAAAAVAFFINSDADIMPYSPIVHWHEVAVNHELPHDFHFWQTLDFFMIKKSAAFWILTLEGWRESFGISQELEFSRDIQKPVLYITQSSDSADYVLTDVEPTHTIALPG